MAAAKKSQLQVVRLKIADLKEWPGNPRLHDLELLAESLAANGQYKPIVVRKKDMRILAGHGTVKAAKRINWTEIDAVWFEGDDEEARRIVLIDNRSNERGGYDPEKHLALLNSMSTLDATGYSSADLERLNAVAASPPPEDPPPPPDPTFEFICEAPDEETRQDLIDDMERRGFKCRIL